MYHSKRRFTIQISVALVVLACISSKRTGTLPLLYQRYRDTNILYTLYIIQIKIRVLMFVQENNQFRNDKSIFLMMDFLQLLCSIHSLLADSILDESHPDVPSIVQMYKTDRVMYESTVRSWNQQYVVG
ncbi:hypothetical protein BUALT_Bualt10G0005300 [Buddleja alternifolia]|uniref:Uncharacterized protein n=1 Tax=Buddleja alternifolia TaxID=168488 RepID=A0AAV6X280_9LAMI|nr:hypothetical protein BUALT_Bualt10G0005300 [Buddleja alternifolia]